MLPSQTIDNPRYGACIDAVTLSNFGVSYADKRTDVGDLLVGQFPNASHMQSAFDCVSMIAEARDPLKVCGAIIGLVAVNVIDLWQSEWVRNEREGNEAVDRDVAVKRCGTQINGQVASTADTRSHNASMVRANSLPSSAAGCDAIETANSTEIADLVESGDFCDWYRLPFFVAHQAIPRKWVMASPNTALNADQGGHPCR